MRLGRSGLAMKVSRAMKTRLSWIEVSAAAFLLLPAGCGDFKAMERFAFRDQKAQAQKNWDSVRSDVKLQLVRQHLEAGRLSEAEKLLDQVMSLSPHDARPYVLAARLRLEQGKLAEAKEAILIAQGMAGCDADTYYYSGIIAQRYGFHKGALVYYRKASNAAPMNAMYVCAQAEMLLTLDRPSDALQLIESRKSDFDSDVNLRVLSARIARRLELRGPAVAFVRDAVQLAKDDRLLALQLADILDWARADEELIDLLGPYLSRRPEMPASAKCMLAQAYLRTNHPIEAGEILKPLMQNQDVAGISAMISAHSAATDGNMDDAVRSARLAIPDAERQKAPEPFLMIALTSLKSGDAAQALNMAQRALTMDARNISALCLKGQAHEALGELDEARWSYLDALAIDPQEFVVKALLDNLTRRLPENSAIGATANPSDQSVIAVSAVQDEPCEGEDKGQ
jgi:Tfp pilus assembly protein PilF